MQTGCRIRKRRRQFTSLERLLVTIVLLYVSRFISNAYARLPSDRLKILFSTEWSTYTPLDEPLLRTHLEEGTENAHMKRSCGGLHQNRSYLTWIWGRNLIEEGEMDCHDCSDIFLSLSLLARTKRFGCFHPPRRWQGSGFYYDIPFDMHVRVGRFYVSVLLPFFLFVSFCLLVIANPRITKSINVFYGPLPLFQLPPPPPPPPPHMHGRLETNYAKRAALLLKQLYLYNASTIRAFVLGEDKKQLETKIH